ncbi:hypothetical protein [Spongiactinospora sp. TRM90649]|uniref:hypothetical protein n=1 Tax=Spongiactinospora sp. TRM90649 TaxID=3031114 RepID=UPI0023F6DCBD|nr:hypothetical protein [Spongiactinospora sp. TRM90649]MDF5758671.1 hypothetical protein [Spongiactinospora sp. TRM90649]
MAVCVVLAGGITGWVLLNGDDSGPPPLSAYGRRNLARSPTPKPEAVKLRPISGDQLCAVVPDGLRKPLVTDGKYGGKDASTRAATRTEKRAACSWNNSKMDVGGGAFGHRTLTISVEAKSTETQGAAEYARKRFDDDRKGHDRRVNIRDGKRVDGRTTGSSFGEPRQLGYGDASYSQSSIGHSGLHTTVFVRQGPWLIQVAYGGANRTGAKYPTGDETRDAAGKVAELVTAEMAKDADKVKLAGPCGIVSVRDVEAAFFPEADGPAVDSRDGRIKQNTCTWSISEPVDHKPGQEYTSRGGQLQIHVVDWGDGELGSRFQYDRATRQYDRYLAQGGIGDANIQVGYEPRQNITGLGEKAFAVLSTSTKPDADPEDDRPRKELLIKVLSGDHTIDFTFRGTTTGGGLTQAKGYQEPTFDPTLTRKALERLAKTFVPALK